MGRALVWALVWAVSGPGLGPRPLGGLIEYQGALILLSILR